MMNKYLKIITAFGATAYVVARMVNRENKINLGFKIPNRWLNKESGGIDLEKVI